jgi:hypothetical protein
VRARSVEVVEYRKESDHHRRERGLADCLAVALDAPPVVGELGLHSL